MGVDTFRGAPRHPSMAASTNVMTSPPVPFPSTA